MTPESTELRPRPAHRRRRAAIIAIIGIVVGIGGVVGSGFDVVSWLTRNETAFSTLEISVDTLERPGITVFAVPTDVSFEELPSAVGGACSEEQRTWLGRSGVLLQATHRIDFTNTASSGSMISLTGLRGSPEPADDSRASASPEPDSVLVECRGPGASRLPAAGARLDPASGQPASYAASTFGIDESKIRDAPLVINLRPGETVQLVVTVLSSEAFVGEVLIDARVGGEVREVQVPLAGGALEAPPLRAAGSRYLVLDGTEMRCLERGTTVDEPVACDVATLIDRPFE